MTPIDPILKRIRAGHRVRFYFDYFGGQYVEVPVFGIGWPRRRIKVTPDELQTVRRALSERRRRPEAD